MSRVTLLWVVRRRAAPTGAAPVTVIGIDDFAFKRGQRYGTLMCDLEQRWIVDLLPDREPATIEAWLKAHLEITSISRDRGGGYGRGATKAAPRARLMHHATVVQIEDDSYRLRHKRKGGVMPKAKAGPA